MLDQKGETPRRPARDVGEILEEVCREHGVGEDQVLGRTRRQPVVRAREEFLLRAHEEAGDVYAALGWLCAMSHTSVRAVVERARCCRAEGLV